MTTKKQTLLLALVICPLIAYFPGLTGGFAFDDYANILDNPSIVNVEPSISSILQSAWSGAAGPLKRPVSMISFAGNYALSGAWPMGFKITNLLIHIINGFLVFFVAKSVFLMPGVRNESGCKDKSFLLALVISLLWLLHPINLTSVLYVVQRMTSLSAMFSFLSMISYFNGRLRILSGRSFGLVLVFVATPAFILLGVLSKENAILTVPLLFIAELLFFRFSAKISWHKHTIIACYIVGAAVAVLAISTILLKNPSYFEEHYQYRPFTLLERLMTEARVLWFYLGLILLPRLPAFALYHDDFAISTSLVTPNTTLLALLGIFAIVVLAVTSARKKPLLSFAIAWFLIGHTMESTILPLELVHEHRNYFPLVGVLIGLVFLSTEINRNLVRARSIILVSLIVAVLYGGVTFLRASDWSDPITAAVVEAHNHPNSSRSVYAAARVYYGLYQMRGDKELYEKTIQYLEHAANTDNSSTLPYIALMRLRYEGDTEFSSQKHSELLRRFREELISFPETTAIAQLIKCHADDEACKIPLREIASLYYAALSNDKLVPSIKARLLVDFGVLNVNHLGDFEVALTAFDEAVALMPDQFHYRLIRAQIMLASGNTGRLTEELKYLRNRSNWSDVYQTPIKELQALENQLNIISGADSG